MQTEIEAKSLNVDHDALRVKLREMGATLESPMRLMRRYAFDFPDRRLDKEKRGWVRVRDEGERITLSYKQLSDRTLHGTSEVMLTVDSFEQAKTFLETLGLVAKSYQETKRESWRLGEIEIELDHWPWTQPYIEIEAPDEATMRDTFEKLDLSYDDAVFGSVEVVYLAEYDVSESDVNHIEAIRFDLPPAEILARHPRKAAA